MFCLGDLGLSGESVQGSGLDVALGPRPLGVAQPLGVFLPPAEAQPEEQMVVADRDVVGGQGVYRQSAQIMLVDLFLIFGKSRLHPVLAYN